MLLSNINILQNVTNFYSLCKNLSRIYVYIFLIINKYSNNEICLIFWCAILLKSLYPPLFFSNFNKWFYIQFNHKLLLLFLDQKL